MDTSALQFIFALPMLTIGGILGVRAFVYPRAASLFGLSCAVFCLQFMLGPALGFLNLSSVINAGEGDVSMAFLGVYAFWFGVAVTGFLWPSPLVRVHFLRPDGALHAVRGIFANLTYASLRVSTAALVALYAVVFVVRVFMMTQYDVVLSGRAQTAQQLLDVPYVVLAVWRVCEFIGMAFVYVTVTKMTRNANLFESPVLLAIFVLELLFAFTQGRRYILMLVLFAVFAYLVIRGGMKAWHTVVGLIGAAVMLQFVFPFFFFLRQQWTINRGASPIEWVGQALEQTANQLTGGGYEAREYTRNVTERLNAMAFNYAVAGSLRSGVPAMQGDMLMNTIYAVIPRVLYPEKLLWTKESDRLVNERLGIPGEDQVSNLPAFGLADFGITGCVLYGILFVAGIRFVEMMLRWMFIHNPLVGVAALGNLVTVCIFTMEFTPIMFLETIRAILILLILAFAWALVFPRRDTTSALVVPDRRLEPMLYAPPVAVPVSVAAPQPATGPA